mgnify:CR=1 FL=1
MSFERLQAFITALPDRVPAIAAASAPQIAAQLRADATTGRGNVPSYGKFGDAPITATASQHSSCTLKVPEQLDIDKCCPTMVASLFSQVSLLPVFHAYAGR